MSQDRTHKVLVWTAIVGAVALVGALLYDHFARFGPGDVAYIDGSNLFMDGAYERAIEFYNAALKENPRHVFALRGLANSYTQLKRYDEALTAIAAAIRLEPDNACNYATRGIIHDRMGRHEQAIADYRRAVAGCEAATKGMHWLDRLLYNVHERPPTVSDRLAYLEAQMRLPPEKRLLRVPELDDQQRPYKR